MKKVLAICGSTRQSSSNLQLIEAIRKEYADKLEMNLSANVGTLPQFNPDDLGKPGEAVLAFRKQICDADGVLICTPEYAMGVPGALKNAIDWTVSTCEFSKKPVALITASTLGQKAHKALLDTLEVIEADIVELLISHIQTKVKDGVVADGATNEQIAGLMQGLMAKIEKHDR